MVGKVFFDVLPLDMITVPSCHECDRGKGDGGPIDLHLEEEYMRNVICMAWGPGTSHPVAKKLLHGKVMDSFKNSPKLLKNFARDMTFGPTTIKGIWVPEAMKYTPDFDRFRRVLIKIVKGLFFHVMGTRVPDDHDIWLDHNLKQTAVKRQMDFIRAGVWHGDVLGDAVFGYMVRRSSPDSQQTIWLLIFYDRYAATAIVAPKGMDLKETKW